MLPDSRPPDSRDDELARSIQAKREEIEATGLCQWGYNRPDPPKRYFGPWFPFGGRVVFWIEWTWPFLVVRKGHRHG